MSETPTTTETQPEIGLPSILIGLLFIGTIIVNAIWSFRLFNTTACNPNTLSDIVLTPWSPTCHVTAHHFHMSIAHGVGMFFIVALFSWLWLGAMVFFFETVFSSPTETAERSCFTYVFLFITYTSMMHYLELVVINPFWGGHGLRFIAMLKQTIGSVIAAGIMIAICTTIGLVLITVLRAMFGKSAAST